MKTQTTGFSHYVNIALTIIAVLLAIIALLTFYLALQGDTTLLGDPYYEDQILAPERAFGPWALAMIACGIAVIAKVVSLWKS